MLGEIETDHREIEGLAERAAELKMVPQAKLLGLGLRPADQADPGGARRRERHRDPAPRGGGGVVGGRAGALLDPVPRRAADARAVRGARVVLSGLGLDRAAYLGVTLDDEFTNLLVALETARALVVAGRHRRVLVVTTDLIEDEAERMESFALFSDSAASCLVTAAGGEPVDGPRYEILSTASTQETAALDWSHEISANLAPRPTPACWSRSGSRSATSTA